MKTFAAIQNENFGDVSMRQLAPFMGGKFKEDGSENSVPTLDRTTSEEVPNPDGIYTSRFVMSFVQGLDKMVREEVKSQNSAKNRAIDKKYSAVE
jgi:hypothetical protein